MPLRILQLTNRIPYPLNDGGSIGIHYYIEGYLKAGCELSLLAMNTTRHWVDVATLPDIYQQLKGFTTIRIDNRIRPVAAFQNLFKSTSYHIDRFISKEYEVALSHLLNTSTYDIIHLDGIYLTPYIPVIRQLSKAKIVLRLHNPEFRIWERLAVQGSNPAKRWYLHLLAKRLRSFEVAHINDYDLILALSAEDEAFYRASGCTVSVYIHPFGIDAGTYPLTAIPKPPSPKFYHLGAMDWLPNQESVDWLLRDVWPLVIQQVPDAKLFLAGRNMPQRYQEMNIPGVAVSSEVADAAAYETDKNVLLVPLLSGGGVRIKIYRGMAAGKAIITTPIGLEGIDAQDGAEVLIAKDATAFANQVIYLINNPGRVPELGTAARKLITEQYNAPKLMAALIARYKALIAIK